MITRFKSKVWSNKTQEYVDRGIDNLYVDKVVDLIKKGKEPEEIYCDVLDSVGYPSWQVDVWIFHKSIPKKISFALPELSTKIDALRVKKALTKELRRLYGNILTK